MEQTEKTNNSFLGNKVDLRLNHLPMGALSVLDCYGGEGLIWKAVGRASGRKIRYVSIDTVDYGTGFYLPGNNLAYLQSMDLSKFNVVDLDAYGVPFEQLEVLFDRGYEGRVFVTFVQTVMGALPYDLLYAVGFTKEMVSRVPTLFYKRGWEHFLEYLGRRGVRSVTHRSHSRKHYATFMVGATGRSESGSHTQAGGTSANPS